MTCLNKFRRVLAICAFVTGGVAAEMAQPLQCSLLNAASTAVTRRNKRAEV